MYVYCQSRSTSKNRKDTSFWIIIGRITIEIVDQESLFFMHSS